MVKTATNIVAILPEILAKISTLLYIVWLKILNFKFRKITQTIVTNNGARIYDIFFIFDIIIESPTSNIIITNICSVVNNIFNFYKNFPINEE